MGDIKVIKKDGSSESFQKKRIRQVLKAAGIAEEQAELVAEKVKTWIVNKKLKRITTLEIRTKVFEEIEKLNHGAASLYTWYQKRKDDELTKKIINDRKKY